MPAEIITAVTPRLIADVSHVTQAVSSWRRDWKRNWGSSSGTMPKPGGWNRATTPHATPRRANPAKTRWRIPKTLIAAGAMVPGMEGPGGKEDSAGGW